MCVSIVYLPSVTPKAWVSRLRIKNFDHTYSRLRSNFSHLVEMLELLQYWLTHFETNINYFIIKETEAIERK